jgi:cytochrome oxidase Cu insertion factor (SCO1/SenC/PrrC family)
MNGAAFALLLLAASLMADASLSPKTLSKVGAHPSANADAPMDAAMVDEAGATRRFSTLFDGKSGGEPVLLVFAQYRCTYLCGVGMPLLTHALDDAELRPGTDYRLAAISFDANEGPADATRFRRQRLSTQSPASSALTLFTADRRTVERLTHALGYGIAYDAQNRLYAHDASVYVLNGAGRVSAVLGEFALQPDALRNALLAARTSRPQPPHGIASLCYALLAPHGRYSRVVLIALQIGGALSLAGGGIWLLRLKPRGRAR